MAEELNRANDKLKETEHRFRQLAENIDQTFWLFDPPTDQIIYVSPSYEKITGRSAGKRATAGPARFSTSIHPEIARACSKA